MMKFGDDGMLAEDQAVRFTANSIVVANVKAINDKVYLVVYIVRS